MLSIPLAKLMKGKSLIKPAAKAVTKTLPKVSGMPDWFPSLVAKIEKEGRLATEGTGLGDNLKIKELVVPSKSGKGGDEIFTKIEYPDGKIEIQANVEGGAYGQPFELHYTPPKTDMDVTTGKPIKEPGDFSVVEQRPKPDPNDIGNYEMDYEMVSTNEALSDLEKLEKITTGKIKNLKEAEARAAQRTNYDNSPYEDVSTRFPEPDYADGGLASFANGGKAKKKKIANDELENLEDEILFPDPDKKVKEDPEFFFGPVEKKGSSNLPTEGGVKELKQFIKGQTPRGVGIGYGGPDYGLIAVKPLFNEQDKRPLVQGYFNPSENTNIRGSLGPTEQRLDYSYGNPNASNVNVGFTRNTQMGRPEYMLNLGARFADGGVANFRGGGLIKPMKVISKINEPVTMPVLPSTPTPQVDVSANPIARSLEMSGFTREEIMRILGQQGFADGGRVSMSDGGLTNTIPPAKGPDSQGVESLFRRRYN